MISGSVLLNIQHQVTVRAAQSDEMDLDWGLKIGRSTAEYHLVFEVLRGVPQQLPFFMPVCQELSISSSLALP